MAPTPTDAPSHPTTALGIGRLKSLTVVGKDPKGYMYPIQIYASGTSSADGIVTQTIPVSGRLIALSGCITLTAGAGIYNWYEVSLQATSQFTTNDARGVIAQFGVLSNGTAGFENVGIPLPGIQMPVGSKLYIHRAISGATTAGLIRLNLWFA